MLLLEYPAPALHKQMRKTEIVNMLKNSILL